MPLEHYSITLHCAISWLQFVKSLLQHVGWNITFLLSIRQDTLVTKCHDLGRRQLKDIFQDVTISRRKAPIGTIGTRVLASQSFVLFELMPMEDHVMFRVDEIFW